jgi:hypothetical protein
MRRGMPFPGTWFGPWQGRFPQGPGPWGGWQEDPRSGFGFGPGGPGFHRGRRGRRWEAQEVDDSVRGVFETFGHLRGAVAQVAHTGNDVQLAEAEQILTQARQSIYRVLAEGEPEVPDPGEPTDA